MAANAAQLPIVNVLRFSLFWALQIVISKMAFEAGANPVSFTIQVGVVALFVLAMYILPRKGDQLKRLSSATIVKLLLETLPRLI